ncbi:MAG: hypothetical protein ACYTGN_12500 [Planctomycetota bacterium]|jgi:hypothetical protein
MRLFRVGFACLLVACPPACCATNRLWRAVDDAALQLEGASLARDGTLSLAMKYERGATWLVTADLGRPTPEWTDAKARRVRVLEGPLPPSELRIELGMYDLGTRDVARAYHMRTKGKSGAENHTVWVYGAGYQVVVQCPSPVDWSRAATYGAVAATPLTVVLDVVAAPVYVVWILVTAGGHGDPWLPWCG